MNAEQLLAYYERVADAPDAVSRLRRFILDLAVRGRLVQQDTSDEPATKFDRPVLAKMALPFEIPTSWNWSRLHTLGKLQGGGTPSKARDDFWSGPIPWVSPKDMKVDYITEAQMSISEAAIRGSAAHLVEAGSILFVVRGMILAHSFPIAVTRVPVAINQDMKALVLKAPKMKEFILRALKGLKPEILKRVQRSSHGTCRLEGSDYSDFLVPIPPLAEQHRIVAKVDELMALCDRLEAARAEREAARDRLAAASLARLNAPDPDPAAFADHARFTLANLTALTTRPDQIKQLRQTILNLAVRGRLVAKTSGELATVGQYRKLQNGYAFKSGWFSKTGVRLLRNANVGHGEIRWDDTVSLPEDRVPEFERFKLYQGDTVLTLDRPFIVTGTKVARVAEADLPALLLQRVGRFVEVDAGLSEDYLFLWINSPLFNEQIDPGRSNGVPHISSKQVEAAKIYVPSLPEQQRIVAKVDELMALCDRLEASLAAGDAARRRLLGTLLAEAFAPAGIPEMRAAE